MNLEALITTVGYVGLFALIFAESGLLIGFFLPGDSLLFTAGFLASQGYFEIFPLIILCFVGAVLGDSFGYYFGKKVGPRIFTRDDSLFFNKEHVKTAQVFFEAHGPKTIFLARFMPVIRTFAPILAGVGQMDYKTFLSYNFFGGLAWGVGIPLTGYYLGGAVPSIDRYLLPIIVFVILGSILPPLIHILRSPHERERLKKTFTRLRGK